MEKGTTDTHTGSSSSGLRVSDKKSSSHSSSFLSSMGGGANLDRPSDVRGGGCGVDPTTNSGGANEAVGNIYRHDNNNNISSSRGENFAAAESTTSYLQPFNIFTPSYSTIIPYKSPAVLEMAASVEYPFTSAQWKELERQAMIYKYMISCVPVPPDLLFPLSRNFAAPPVGSSLPSIYGGGRYSKNGDPEPGRCKRTDGKKWRCSKEVAPHQKYCERHLHRGRPRSRKPVEPKNIYNAENNNHKKITTRLEQSRSLPTVLKSNSTDFVAAKNEPLLLFNAKTDLSICTPYYKATERELGMTTMESNTESRNGNDEQQPWQNLMGSNMGMVNEGGYANNYYDCSTTAHIFNQEYVDEQQQQALSVFPYPNFPHPEIDIPNNGFIDAWSIDNDNNLNNSRNNASVESSMSLNEGDLSPSLNLSMAMAAAEKNVLDEDLRTVQIGSSMDFDGQKNKDSLWLSPVSWELFARGGPLGEALQPGTAVGGSSPPSPIGTPATTVSSPSGVLHRTLFSHSDGSVCNSPTFTAPPPSEVSLQWLN